MKVRTFVSNHSRLILISLFLVVWLVLQLSLAGPFMNGAILGSDPGGTFPTPWWP